MDVDITESDLVYDGMLSRVRLDRVRFPDGSESEREVVEHLDAVAMVPLHADGTVTLLRQYRHPLGREVLEIPAGMLDQDGEPAAEAAHRELAEEVGLAAGSLRHLCTIANSAGWCDERTMIYLATDLRQVTAPEGFTAEAEEAGMSLQRLALAEALATVLADLADSKTLIGLLLAGRQPPGAPAGDD